ncbi:hypothetical protein [Pseudomonas sp. DG56-2]|uniref:hypothetical protein n=1 Tax=Pseudomonas sp. DG56-2 TaxID=2320270 RepID=UPI0010A68CF5|nr:hypothetical protein [Pseudomonas sp. DG56-2]
MSEFLPAIGSTVRIVKIGLPIWPDAEQFIGADCTLCATFKTGDTLMVAVEHQEEGICCCFRAEMVRTPQQVEAEQREEFIRDAVFSTDSAIPVEMRIAAFGELYDLGYRAPLRP